MSCGQISALFTFGGVLIELGAIVWILLGVGLGDWMIRRAQNARLALGQAANRIRTIIPWMKPKDAQAAAISAALELSAANSVGIELQRVRATDRPPPASLDEVGEWLNRIAEDLNAIEDDLTTGRKALRADLLAEIELARSDSASRTDAIDELVERETRQRFVDRRREAIAFAGGVFLQLVGASMQLAA